MTSKKIFLILAIVVLLFASFISGQSFGAQGYSGSSPNYGSSYSNAYGSNVYGADSYGSSSYGSASFVRRQNFQSDFNRIYGSEAATYWPKLKDPASCFARQDIVLQVSPAGCKPAVVRSDLLAEQNVPVFCEIDALKLNPLIDVKEIRGIRFRGNYPKEIVGVGFHPARAALRTYDRLLGSPLTNNIGYAVVVLKRNPVEKDLPEFINFNLNALIDYNSAGGFGIGRTEFLLRELNDDDWISEKNKQSFWQGRYFVRLENADSEFATVSIYQGDRKINTFRIQRRGVSPEFYMPGFYCQAGLQVAFDGFAPPDLSARLSVDNDVIEVARGSSFLDGKCRVLNINVRKDSQNVLQSNQQDASIDIRCGRETVKLKLGIKGLNKGDRVIYDPTSAGKFEDTSLWEVLEVSGSSYVISKDKGVTKVTASIGQIRPELRENLPEQEYDLNTDRYFKEAIDNFERVADEYPFEKNPEQLEIKETSYFGELALREAINLARFYGKQATEARLIEKFIEKYPESYSAGELSRQLSASYFVKDGSSRGVAVNLDNRVSYISLLDFNIPKTVPSAELEWGRETIKVELNALAQLRGFTQQPVVASGSRGEIALNQIVSPDEVRINVRCNDEERVGRDGRKISGSFKTYTLRRGEPGVEACGLILNLKNVESETYAKIRILPKVNNIYQETNFTVGVGIEKRLIKLNPDKAREKIDNLNKSIKKFESVSKTLNKVNTALKSACFVTAGVLTVKNFLSGLDGEGLARQEVMKNYWNAECSRLVNDPDYASQKGVSYSTLDACYLGEREKINRDVEFYKNALNKVNERLEPIEEANTVKGKGLLGEDFLDTPKAVNGLFPQVRDGYPNVNSNVRGQNISLNRLLGNANYERRDFTYTQLRDLTLNAEILNDPNAPQSTRNIAQRRINDLGVAIEDNKELNIKFQAERDRLVAGEPQFGDYIPASGERETGVRVKRILDVKKRDQWGSGAPGFGSDVSHVSKVGLGASSTLGLGGGIYALGLSETPDNQYIVKEVWKRDESGQYSKVSIDNLGEFETAYRIGEIKAKDKVSLSNRYLNPTVKYYEIEPYKGMPAVVPFDIRNGWYAGAEQALPVFGRQGAYDASGLPTSFWVCNVGDDGREEFFENRQGDICQLFNFYTGQSFDIFPGLSEQETRKIINKAIQSLREAATQYGSKKSVRIGGELIPRDPKPAALIPSTQCQNFMKPEDCAVLFNVCDPVICPASRCDFGGQYPVADVIQTGIVGSALLCLPNSFAFGGDVAIPVCLTGIQAGIDSYLSILKSHQQCLQENIDSGQTVGICDAITSVYLCEFFWRQAAPLADVFVPKLFEIAKGERRTRGGGEYLGVQGAWENAKGSVDFFTNYYAANSFQAFRVRSTQEAGSEFCRAFIGAKGPKAIKALVEPDSPPQFNAWFSSIRFNDATVPATAQYKVFYHIFAGKDQGTYYSVYLKDPPQSGFYSVNPFVPVASGYVQRGAYATDTADFTAPEGYKQLCVRINNKEECGFKQVSTSFAVNYLRDQFVSGELLRKDIRSQEECISGGTNPSALLNFNIQSGVEEAINPSVYNRGVVRVCASDNPGRATDPRRFVDVGICSDVGIKCWLDTKSVDNALSSNIGITQKGIKNETLSELRRGQIQELERRGEILPVDEIGRVIVSLSDELNKVNKINENNIQNYLTIIDNTFMKTVFNYQKANLILLKGQFYRKVAEKLRGVAKIDRPPTKEIIREDEATLRPGSGGDAIDYSRLQLEVGTVSGLSRPVNIIYRDDKFVLFIYSNRLRYRDKDEVAFFGLTKLEGDKLFFDVNERLESVIDEEKALEIIKYLKDNKAYVLVSEFKKNPDEDDVGKLTKVYFDVGVSGTVSSVGSGSALNYSNLRLTIARSNINNLPQRDLVYLIYQNNDFAIFSLGGVRIVYEPRGGEQIITVGIFNANTGIFEIEQTLDLQSLNSVARDIVEHLSNNRAYININEFNNNLNELGQFIRIYFENNP